MAAFRDAGIEVIYTGLYQTPEGVVKTAIQEGADVLALSDMTGSMRHIATAVLKALKKEDISNIHVVAGGLIPKKDIPILEKMGVTGNFGPGTPIQEIINHIVTVASQKNDLSSV
jgi:methylmalonyl-CoA mutase C-terminal domain/subunit